MKKLMGVMSVAIAALTFGACRVLHEEVYVLTDPGMTIVLLEDGQCVSVEITPHTYKNGRLVTDAEGPYGVRVSFSERLGSLDGFRIDGIRMEKGVAGADLFEGDFTIYDAILQRYLDAKEREDFLRSRTFEREYRESDYFIFFFEGADIDYRNDKEISIVIELTLTKDGITRSMEKTFAFKRKRRLAPLFPTA